MGDSPNQRTSLSRHADIVTLSVSKGIRRRAEPRPSQDGFAIGKHRAYLLFMTIRRRVTLALISFSLGIVLLYVLGVLGLAAHKITDLYSNPINYAGGVSDILPYSIAVLEVIERDQNPTASLNASIDRLEGLEKSEDYEVLGLTKSVLILDSDFKCIAASQNCRQLVGANISPKPWEKPLLKNAAVGNTNPNALADGNRRDQFSLAAPVKDAMGRTRAVLLVRATYNANYVAIATQLLRNEGFIPLVMLACCTASALALGTSLTFPILRRLDRIRSVVRAWQDGDFEARIPTSDRDEISELGKAMNEMAEKLGALFVLKEELAANQEREVIAMDLHDSLKQQILATAFQVEAAKMNLPDDSPAQANLSAAKLLVGMVQSDLRTIIDRLEASREPLCSDELRSLLNRRLIVWGNGQNLAIDLQISSNICMTHSEFRSLMKIVEEGISNSIRHSGGDRVSITLSMERGLVQFCLTDNGSWDGKISRGRGIRNIYARSERLPEGTCKIERTDAGSMRVHISYKTQIRP